MFVRILPGEISVEYRVDSRLEIKLDTTSSFFKKFYAHNFNPIACSDYTMKNDCKFDKIMSKLIFYLYRNPNKIETNRWVGMSEILPGDSNSQNFITKNGVREIGAQLSLYPKNLYRRSITVPNKNMS